MFVYFLWSAAVSSLGSGFLFNPDSSRFSSAIARPGFKPLKMTNFSVGLY